MATIKVKGIVLSEKRRKINLCEILMILINYIRNIKGLLANIYHMLTVFIYIKNKYKVKWNVCVKIYDYNHLKNVRKEY